MITNGIRRSCLVTPIEACSSAAEALETVLEVRVELPHAVRRLAPREGAAAVGRQHAEPVDRGGGRRAPRPSASPRASASAFDQRSRRRRSPRRARARMPRSTGTPRASASSTRHGNAVRCAGATNVTAPPNTAARSAAVERAAHVQAALRDAGGRGEIGDRRLLALAGADHDDRKVDAGAPDGGEVRAPARRWARRGRRAARSPRAGRARGGGRPRRWARRSRAGAAPAITRIRSPSCASSPRRTAIECVGTTTASACLTARLSIARCHATDRLRPFAGRLPRAAGPRSSRRSGRCRARGRGARAARSSVGEWIMPAADARSPTPSCSAAASSRRASAVRRTPASPAIVDRSVRRPGRRDPLDLAAGGRAGDQSARQLARCGLAGRARSERRAGRASPGVSRSCRSALGCRRRRRRVQRLLHELLDVGEVGLVLVDAAVGRELDRRDRAAPSP